MGYFKADATKRLTLTDPAYYVDIATDLKWADIKHFGEIQTGADGTPEFSQSADVFLRTVIKGWNLDDESGQVVPVTPENIDRLTRNDVMLIIQEAGGVVESDDAKKNGTSEQSQPFPAQT